MRTQVKVQHGYAVSSADDRAVVEPVLTGTALTEALQADTAARYMPLFERYRIMRSWNRLILKYLRDE